MDGIMQFLINGIELSPDLLFVARLVSVILVCDVFSALVQVVVQIAKGVR